MEWKKEIEEYIQAHTEEGYLLLMELAQIPAPSNKEKRRMEFCRDWLEKWGAKGVYTDEALNVVYPYEADGEKPLVVFMAHTDVVFPDETPLPWKEKDGKLCCPGVGDDTANLVALLLAARYVTQKHLKPDGCGILFVCNSGEEGLGNLKGSRKICQQYGSRIRHFYSFDGTMEAVVCRAVGSERFRVTVSTEGGHSYGCFGNPNAIAVLAQIVTEIYAIQVPEGGKTTYNVGVVQGGTSVNTIAQEVSMLCEYRSDHAESLDIMRSAFREILERPREGAQVKTEIVGERPCERIFGEQKEERQKLLQDSKELIRRFTGKEAAESPSSTDCNIPLSMGIPSVCYGTYFGAGAHTREEYVWKDSLETGYRVAFASVLRYMREVQE